MRVLLIRPPVPRHTIGLKHIMICEPLELEYVAAGLEGHRVEIFDMILQNRLKRKLHSFNPDVVGTSSYITGVNEVKTLCRTVKQWNHNCKTVVGGVQASCAPEDFADTSIDCIVRGDGTSIMAELMESFQGHRPLREIPGLAIPTEEGGLLFTGERPYMPDADTLPEPRRDLTSHLKHRYYYLFHQPVALMKTTWGCWYDCSFCCTWRVTNGKVYSRSPESIVDELAKLETNEIYIVDDIFLFKPERLSKIASLIRERGIKKNYLVYSRADFIVDHEDIIKEWSRLGLKAVIIGLEAASDTELNIMNKKTTVEYNCKAIEVLRRCGVDTYGSLIPQPDYTLEDWTRLQNFIKQNGLFYVNISPLTPLPGTRIWKEYEGRLTVNRSAHALWDLSHCVLPTVMPLKQYYRCLLKTYVGAILNIRRAAMLTLRTRPPVWSFKFLRLWFGAVRILLQFLNVQNHHRRF